MPPLVTHVNLTDTVSQHLSQDFTRLQPEQTVGNALDWLRKNPPTGRVIYFYVVDGEGRLLGVVPTRRLVLSAPDQQLADIMVREVIALPAEATVLEACEFFILHRLLAFPVVDSERRILGLVDVDLYTSELQDLDDTTQRDDLFQRIGVYLAGGETGSVWLAFRRRFPWLGCNVTAGLIAAGLSGVFERELNKVVALAFFIPVVLNLAESVASQSVSLALQSLHGRRPTWRLLLAQVGRELQTGFLLGMGAGVVVAIAALIWLQQGRLALCLVGGIAGGVAIAAAMGLTLPVLLRLLRLEPRVAAGPIALAAADIVTILVYFNLARWLLG
ncbi:MAG TPA: magnesium transporter [Gemmataceae bacterium]|jgi:magnesium transporter|nr:magnesium transporter [Gemmataceae bacterium]